MCVSTLCGGVRVFKKPLFLFLFYFSLFFFKKKNNNNMKALSLMISLALSALLSVQALPVFDADLAASPLIHYRPVNYRAGKRTPTLTTEESSQFVKEN
ncbi:hypothetical protein BY458DRAFT_311369 [Sporodiniella umbellata]|nr:hypothetical protein BY458DRAFT_311369 [Sporodiniella umbellata]